MKDEVEANRWKSRHILKVPERYDKDKRERSKRRGREQVDTSRPRLNHVVGALFICEFFDYLPISSPHPSTAERVADS